MLQNAYLLAKIGADTAENERNFAEKLATTLHGPIRRRLKLRAGEEGSVRRASVLTDGKDLLASVTC